MRWFLLVVLVTCATGIPQYQKSSYSGVKGGSLYPSLDSLSYRYNETRPGYGAQVRYFNNSQPFYGAYNSSNNFQPTVNYEIGVCYIEVPTASLVKDPAHVPAGNGSRSDLSRIRTCCKGYIKNIHNYKICDPVCSTDCINALCTAPEVCSCFPQHVKNLAGICIPTCPIGCQNGQCSGGECICKEGYRLDSESKFCIPYCRENCGRSGNCTAPNTCECQKGYESTATGSCQPHCDKCGTFSKCTSPNICECLPGYKRNTQGDCVPQCNRDCEPKGKCVAPNRCVYPTTVTTTLKPVTHNPYSNFSRPGYYPGQNYYDNQQSNYPGNQQPSYPNYNPNNYPGYQPGQSNLPVYPSNQNSNYPAFQPSNITGQHSNNPNGQPIYYSPGQQPNYYPGNQHGYYDQNRPNYPDSQNQNSNLPSNSANYPSGSNYPTNQHQYPDNQHYYPQYPNQQQGNIPTFNQSVVISPYSSNQQHLTPDSQVENIETLCSKPCINGICVQRDRCVCNDGYVLDESEPAVSRCKPYCPGGCPNGVCSSPNFCICNQGYYKDHSVKGRANCVKRVRRSADTPVNVAELLVFEIPDDDLEL